MQCKQCNGEFTPKNEQHKYCSNECRQRAFYARQTTTENDQNKTENANTANMITPEILERILAEREARHKAELERVRAELKLEAIETRLAKLEEASEQEEQEPGIAGFKISDLMQAYQMYQQMQNQSK